ncbi:MAG: acyltransferase family protein [Burkholderiaceae bacterium]
MSTDSQYIRSHEGLRGLAALCVVFFHAGTVSILDPRLAGFGPIANGWVSVDLFFALSGFVMFLRYGDRLREPGDSKRFVLRRLGRLYPLHLATLTFFILTWLAMQSTKWVLIERFGVAVGNPELFSAEQFNWPDLVLNLGLLHGVGLRWTDALNYPSWSVSLEFWTYFVFLAVCLSTARWQGRVALFAVLGLISWTWFVLVALHQENFVLMFQAERTFMRILMSFSAGVCVAGWFGRHPGGLPAAGAWQAVAFFCLVFYYVNLGDLGAGLLAGPFVFGLVILALCADTGWLGRILQCGVFGWLGERSYSIYLVHATVLMATSAAGRLTGLNQLWVLTAIYLSLTLLIANFTYRRIEVPARERFRRLTVDSPALHAGENTTGRA